MSSKTEGRKQAKTENREPRLGSASTVDEQTSIRVKKAIGITNQESLYVCDLKRFIYKCIINGQRSLRLSYANEIGEGCSVRDNGSKASPARLSGLTSGRINVYTGKINVYNKRDHNFCTNV